MVTNGRIEPDVQDSDCSIPSVTDREYLWFFGEGKHGIRKNQVLSGERGAEERRAGHLKFFCCWGKGKPVMKKTDFRGEKGAWAARLTGLGQAMGVTHEPFPA